MNLSAEERRSDMIIVKVCCSQKEYRNRCAGQVRLLAQRLYLFLFIIVTFIGASVDSFQLPQPLHQQATNLSSLGVNQETRCLTCIRSITSAGVDLTKKCEGYYCGPYQFSYQYWAEAGKPGRSDGVREFEKCARDTNCAESTVRAYFKKFRRDCNNDGLIDCLDMAALHKAGPTSCSQEWFYKSRYWQAFNRTTCATERDHSGVVRAPVPNLNDHKHQSGNKDSNNPPIVLKNQTLTTECIDCICEALSSCGSSSSSFVSASNCGSGTTCGPFAISQSYWKDGRRPGSSWTACTRTRECSIVTIKNYMDKHKRDCNGDGFVTCEDYAAIHRRGPNSCMNRDLYKEHYWTKFTACRANQKPKNDASLVRVSDYPSDQTTIRPPNDRPASTSMVKESGVVDLASKAFTSPLNMVLTTASTATPTPSPLTTESPPTAQTSTRFVNSNSADRTRPDIGNIHSAIEEDGGIKQHQRLSPVDTYELNPILAEMKPPQTNNENRSSSSQTSATTQHIYEYSESNIMDGGSSSIGINQSSDQFSYENASQSQNSTPSGSDTYRPSSEPATPSDTGYNDNHKTLTTIYGHDFSHHQPPASIVEDYNSLPTIIVGKPLGSISTSRISSPPPSIQAAESHPHDDHDQQHQSTKVMQRPTTVSTQSATTITMSSQTISPATLDLLTSTSSTASQPMMTTKSNKPNTSLMSILNHEDPIDPDYLAHDLGPIGFDRVVNGIVASPDFSRAYPPIPDHLIQQRKQPVSTPPPHRKPSQMHKKEQIVPAMKNQQNDSRENGKNDHASRQPDRQHSMDSSYAHHDESNPQQSPVNPFGESSVAGPDALNMTSLFEAGLNESSKIPSECLDCICDASSNCDSTVQCISKQREKNRCGLYMISWNQYKESDIALTTLMSSLTSSHSSSKNEDLDEKLYHDCSTDKNCAEKLIHLYIEKYSKDCNNDGKIDCYDIAAIHRVGPDQCNSNKFLGSQYWRDFSHCFATDRLTTTVQPQISQRTG